MFKKEINIHHLSKLLHPKNRGVGVIVGDGMLNELMFKIVSKTYSPNHLVCFYCSKEFEKFCNLILSEKLRNVSYKILYVEREKKLKGYLVNNLIHDYLTVINRNYSYSFLSNSLLHLVESCKTIFAPLPITFPEKISKEIIFIKKKNNLIIKRISKLAERNHMFINLFLFSDKTYNKDIIKVFLDENDTFFSHIINVHYNKQTNSYNIIEINNPDLHFVYKNGSV